MNTNTDQILNKLQIRIERIMNTNWILNALQIQIKYIKQIWILIYI